MSNFTRRISDFSGFKERMGADPFLHKIDEELLRRGRAFLAFRNDEATIYYNGNQLCNLSGAVGYLPSVYNHYLPLLRSKTLRKELRKENLQEKAWLEACGLGNFSFSSVYDEILDNIKKEESPESVQASRFYRFSPLNQAEDHDIILLDVEAAFSFTGEKTDRIDLVFYHKKNRQLMFVEVKRLSDDRLYPKVDARGSKPAEVLGQLTRYRKRCQDEAHIINAEYNKVIAYYNELSGGNMEPLETTSQPLLGLLLVEFTRSARDQENKKQVQSMLKEAGFKYYAVGDTASVTPATLTAIYNNL